MCEGHHLIISSLGARVDADLGVSDQLLLSDLIRQLDKHSPGILEGAERKQKDGHVHLPSGDGVQQSKLRKGGGSPAESWSSSGLNHGTARPLSLLGKLVQTAFPQPETSLGEEERRGEAAEGREESEEEEERKPLP